MTPFCFQKTNSGGCRKPTNSSDSSSHLPAWSDGTGYDAPDIHRIGVRITHENRSDTFLRCQDSRPDPLCADLTLMALGKARSPERLIHKR